MQNTIIYLTGYAGSGKYTIAKELCKQADVRLVDNHLINNPIFSLIEIKGKILSSDVWKNTDRIRRVVLDTMIEISPPEFNFVLTNCLFEKDKDVYNDVFDMAEKRNATFIPVILDLSEDEMVKRRTTHERAERFKDTSAENARRDLRTVKRLEIKHQNALTLDISDISAVDVAKNILNFAKSI